MPPLLMPPKTSLPDLQTFFPFFTNIFFLNLKHFTYVQEKAELYLPTGWKILVSIKTLLLMKFMVLFSHPLDIYLRDLMPN